jgi:predicted  nucleic acid-binding Zn-ribbon protein
VEDRPATHGELRTLRRWLVVASIWALAATAIAVVAFLQAQDAKDESSSRATQSDIDRVRDRLRSDVDSVQAEVDDLPTRADYSQLQTRLRKTQRDANQAGDDAADAKDDADKAQSSVSDLEDRVDTLETDSSSTDSN